MKATVKFLMIYPWLLPAIALTACNGSGPLNDQPPSGTVVASGSFISNNTKAITVAGGVQVYDQGNGSYVLRITGFSISAGAGAVTVQANISTQSTRVDFGTPFTGTKNYSYSGSPGTIWSVVNIHSSPNAQDYAQATLQQF